MVVQGFFLKFLLTFYKNSDEIFVMNYSLLDDLPNILERFTNRYMERMGHSNPADINYGECFIWAWLVHQYLKVRGIPSELVSCVSHGGHAWVEIGGVGYDSEHLEGCPSEYLICDFVESDDDDDVEVEIMDEKEFFDHWVMNGAAGWLLVNEDFMMTNRRSISQCGRNYKKTA
jgi:hypothetical protein